MSGRWVAVPRAVSASDELEQESRNREGIHLLLDRYGVIFRELLCNEQPEFRWGRLFRSLRIMELGGELITGRFFEDIPGLQFTRPEGLPELRTPQPSGIYWLNAADPASLCGCPIHKLRSGLPSRLSRTHLVYHDDVLVLISKRLGKSVDIRVPADSADLAAYFAIFACWPSRVMIERINGESAAKSPYLAALRASFELTVDF
jgi:ATP-dependent Lhr-like helicase